MALMSMPCWILKPISHSEAYHAGIEDRCGTSVSGMIHPCGSTEGMGKIEDIERIDAQREHTRFFKPDILGQAQVHVVESG